MQRELRSPDEEVRRLAVVSLAGHPLEETAELVFGAMGDQSWRVRKEAVAVLLGSGVPSPDVVEGLISLLRCHDNAGKRNAAVESLVGLGSVAVKPLCRHLNDYDHDLRKFVIDILGSIGSSDCVPLLIQAMDDPDPNVRSGAVENLGKIGDPQALPALLGALSEGDVWFRFTVLDALAAIGAPVPLPTIAPLMGETLLRRAIYDCLGAVGGMEAFPILLDGIQERARSAREAAAVAVMRLRNRSDAATRASIETSLRALNGTHLLDGILRSLGCAEFPALESLVALLGIIGDPRAAMPLVALSRHERLRAGCVQAFRGIGVAVLPELWDYFPSATPDERAFIAYLTGELQYAPGVERLIEGLKDEMPSLRAASLLSLGKLNVKSAVKRMARLLGDRDPLVRAAAREALDRLTATQPEAMADICAGLATSEHAARRRDAAILLAGLKDADRLYLLAKDEDATVRQAAVSSLSRLRDPQGVKHLVMALVDEVPEVRVAAAAALGELGGDEALQPLLLALNDADPGVQIAALRGLAHLKDDRALAGVALLVSHSRGAVLIAGLKTLAAVGGEAALTPVKEALSDGDEEVVEAAIEILARFGGEWIAECRDDLLRHPHWGVRSSFVRAMGETLGERALPYLKKAREGESDPLVRGEIEGLMDRLG
ncbi:HEAT repeat domain-containing protein [Geomesophilobacter sediminis]|uniref:HEAT repeat domain-containing protein n=1 Tax=Geomesophilobacter sediminis TaxID=2798584 RepID=UPI002E27E707|nr:HEAT repeat domain-containing protein [Geomesophilobacter sediminis]